LTLPPSSPPPSNSETGITQATFLPSAIINGQTPMAQGQLQLDDPGETIKKNYTNHLSKMLKSKERVQILEWGTIQD